MSEGRSNSDVFMSEEDQNSDHDGERHAKDSLTVNAGLVVVFFFLGGGGGGGGDPSFLYFEGSQGPPAPPPPPPPLHPNIPRGIDYSESVTAF